MSAVIDAFTSVFKPKPRRMLSAVPSEPQDVLEARDALCGASSVASRCQELARVAEGCAMRASQALEAVQARVHRAEASYATEATRGNALEVENSVKAERLANILARETEAKAKSARSSANEAKAGLARFEADLARILAQREADFDRLQEELLAAGAQLKAPATWTGRSPIATMQGAIAAYNGKAKAARDAGADSHEFRAVDFLVAARGVLHAFGVEVGKAEELRPLREALEVQPPRDIALLEHVMALKGRALHVSQWALDAREALKTARTFREVDAAVAAAEKARAAQAEAERKAQREANIERILADPSWDKRPARGVTIPDSRIRAAERVIAERAARGDVAGPRTGRGLILAYMAAGKELPTDDEPWHHDDGMPRHGHNWAALGSNRVIDPSRGFR